MFDAGFCLQTRRATPLFARARTGFCATARIAASPELGGAAKDQVDRVSASIALNFADGNGNYALKDRCRFLDIAYGSRFHPRCRVDILVAKGRLTPGQICPGKERLQRIVRKLIGLIKRSSTRDYHKGKPAC